MPAPAMNDTPPPPAPEPDPPLDPRRRRLLFRARHRGTKEADLMVGAFAERHVPGMDEAALTALEAVLEFPDVELTEWLTGRQPIPEEHRSPMLERMAEECSGQGAGLPPELRLP